MEVVHFKLNSLSKSVKNYNIIQGASGFISQPHFLNADEKFVKSVVGLKPDQSQHDYILHFEPVNNLNK